MVFTVVGIYLAVLLGIGLWASRRMEGFTDFLLAGRRLGFWLAAGALIATHFGGGLVMGGGEYGYIYGISGAWYGISTGIGLIILSFLTASKFRKLSLFTVPDYLEYRYNSKRLRKYGALLSVIAILGIIAAQVLAARSALAILGFEGNAATVLAVFIFILYTALGGLWAAALTDIMQVVIASIGVVIGAVIVFNSSGGFAGMEDMIETGQRAVQAGYFSLFGMSGRTIIWLFLPTVMYTLIGQDFYQRLFAAKSQKIAQRAALFGGIFLIAISFFPPILGMGARAHFPLLTDGSQVFPLIIQELFPVGLAAFFLASLLAVIMSTADSLLTAGASHLVKDFWMEGDRTEQELSKEELLKYSRIFTVVLGLGALVIALVMPTIIDALIYSYTMYTAGVFIPVIGGVLWRDATTGGALAALISGALVAIFGIVTGIEILGIPVVIYAAVVSLILFLFVSVSAKGRYRPDGFEN